MILLLNFIAAAVVIGLGILAMAIGQILRKKSISHCGGSSMTFRGEKIRCPACKDKTVPECQKLENLSAKSGDS